LCGSIPITTRVLDSWPFTLSPSTRTACCRAGGHRYFEQSNPLTCLLDPDTRGLQPYGVEGVGPGWLASPLAAFGLTNQERAYPAGTRRGVAQQRRDRSESQVAYRGPLNISPRKGANW
jgi:hypothetical protein